MRCRFASPGAADQRALERFDAVTRGFYESLSTPPDHQHLAKALRSVEPDFELVSVSRERPITRLGVRTQSKKRLRLERFAGAAPVGIQVVTERKAMQADDVCERVLALTGRDLRGARVRAGIVRGHLLKLTLHLPEASGPLDAQAEYAAELLAEGCLGERIVDDWVASISTVLLPRQGALRLVTAQAEMERTFPLSELKVIVDRTLLGVRAGLPQSPCCQQPSQADWVLLEAEAGQHEAAAQSDLLVASTCMPEMLKCFLQDSPFASLRFSNFGERFAYLKYSASGRSDARISARQQLEDKLEAGLREARLGCVIGNGIGYHYCYIDLALLDVDGAVRMVQEVGRAAQLPLASWLLFCDSEWQLEWVGVWDEAPRPVLPMTER